MSSFQRLALSVRRPSPIQQSLPFVSMDWFFPRFPKLTEDKFRWFFGYLAGSFLSGAAFMMFVYHTPYEGADYEHEWKSPLYNSVHQKLVKSGKLEENLRIKRTSFYDEVPPVEEAEVAASE
jgi:hypothetical protein